MAGETGTKQREEEGNNSGYKQQVIPTLLTKDSTAYSVNIQPAYPTEVNVDRRNNSTSCAAGCFNPRDIGDHNGGERTSSLRRELYGVGETGITHPCSLGVM